MENILCDDVLAQIFELLKWPPRLRLVSRQFRMVYDQCAPRASQPSRVVYRRSDAVDVTSLLRWQGIRFEGVPLKRMHGHLYSIKYPNANALRRATRAIEAHRVDVHQCSGLTDVSALARVREVMLHECDELRDLSPLAEVRELTLYWCAILHVPNTYALRHVKLVDCHMIETIELRNIDSLIVKHCKQLKLIGVGTANYIEVESCRSLTKLTSIHLGRLVVGYCSLLTDITATAVRMIELVALAKLHNIQLSQRCGHAVLDRCHALTNLSQFLGCDVLRVYHCNRITSFANMHSIGTLDIVNCQSVRELGTLQGTRVLTLRRMPTTPQVLSRVEAHTVRISNCHGDGDITSMTHPRRVYVDSIKVRDETK